MTKLEYGLSPIGLGTNIILMSLLLDSGLPVCIYTNDSNHLMHKLKSIFNIDDSRLTVVYDPTFSENITNKITDQSKYFSPYFNVDSVNIFNQQWPVKKPNKPCIGLAMFHRSKPGENIDNKYPHSKLYSREVYANIFNLITAAGYDVITFNNETIEVDHKIWMLNELCECVIGYEGGIAHIAHLLKIPSIILPYHHCGDGVRPLWADDGLLDVNLLYTAHKLHIDRRTYFLSSPREIVNWSPEQLRQMILDLHNLKGNNILFESGIVVIPDMLQVVTDIPGLDDMNPWLSDFEFQFISKYIKRRTFD